MSDLRYGHEDISYMTYNIHVDILLGCLFVCATIAYALRWRVALVGVILYWVLLIPSWDAFFRYMEFIRRRRSNEAVIVKKDDMWP